MPTHATLDGTGKVPSAQLPAGGPGGATWGGIAGTLSDQTDLQTAISALVPTTTTVNGHALSANVTVTASDVGLGSVNNTADAAKAVLTATKWVTARSLAGNSVDGSADVAFANKFIVQGTADTGLSGPQFLGALGTGIVKNTTTTGVLSIAVANDFPTLNQNTSGTASNVSGTPALPNGTTATTQTAGDNSTKLATTAYARAAAPNSSYRTLLDSSGSHTAAKVAGTYGLGQGDIAAVTGTGTAYPLNTIAIAAADYPSVDGLAPKLRVRFNINANDVAPFTGTFVCGLHPVTRPATSGGTGLCIYTIGAAVSGSTVTGTNLAADSANLLAGSDFAIPSDGQYVLAFVTNQTMATNSHVHISASLQLRNA